MSADRDDLEGVLQTRRAFSPSEMGALEDSVCRASHSAELALKFVEDITSTDAEGLKIPLSKSERELLYFAVNEAYDHAEKARRHFTIFGRMPSETQSHRPPLAPRHDLAGAAAHRQSEQVRG